MVITFSEHQSILWIIMMLSLVFFCSYYFSDAKSNPRQTLMLIQLMTCVGPGCRTRPECCLLRLGLHLIGSKLSEVCITDEF